jgi:hypothetical protein
MQFSIFQRIICTKSFIKKNCFFYFKIFSGEIQTSTYPGRIIVTEPKGLVQPRINVDKHSTRQVVLNGQITLPCVAQGHPVPTYRWVLHNFNQKLPLVSNPIITTELISKRERSQKVIYR